MKKRNSIRNLVVTMLVFIMFTAFVAPIPVASETERMEALSKAPVLDGRSPTIGHFERECSFEHEGTKTRVVVSGETYVEDGELRIRYTQELLTFGDGENVLTSETLEKELKLSDMLGVRDAPEDIGEPIKKAITSSWGTFNYFWWNGFKMIQSPGSPQRSVDYEHPDNYYFYHPGEFNVEWHHRNSGSRYAMHHISQSQITTAINEASIWRIVNIMIGGLLGLWYISIPATAWYLAAVAAVGAFLVLLGAYQFILIWWLNAVLAAEQGDGFSYSYYWPDMWVSCSYGGWNNLWIRSYWLGGSL